MGVACGMHGGEERCIQGFGRESSRKETRWKTLGRWEDNIRLDLKEIVGGAWIDLSGFE